MTEGGYLDVDKLILCVYNRPALWNRHCDNHNNRYKTRLQWEEVSSELNMPVDTIKKRWNNLRDQFRKEYVRVNKPKKPGTVATIKTSSWSYYESLLFLAKQIVPKPPVREYPLSEADSPDEEVHEDNRALSPFGETSSESKSVQVTSLKNSKSVKVRTSSAEQSFREPVKQVCCCKSKEINHDDYQEHSDTEKTKRELYKPRRNDRFAEDPDRNFLMSLLPHLTEVPRNRKLIVQRKLLDVFLEEETTKEWGD
ncbi:uncharacterized protein LOC106718532 [Papilio machaon]|uniref:uncharacterized protein LOC106718532 n=1 Tax=Papilio machaon TaxID=76193 RepID=UPI001E665473|nr:uncharacterized protein LOC106718532 [Papilio machaon]